jgi:DNA adenine methylase
MKPLFIWAGGKNRMLKKYAGCLPSTFDKYIEPFFGGGAMFVWAYNKNPDAQFVINDVNESIISIYREIKNDLEPFQQRLNDLEKEYLPLEKPERKKWFYELRHEHAYDYEKWSKSEESATLYFLMKTAFNGIWQINKNTNNRFGTPFGLGTQKDKVYDRDVVLWWHNALQKTTVLSEDFQTVVKNHVDKGSYVFMDPPYRNSFTQYATDFNDVEQQRVIDSLKLCQQVGAAGLLSNRDADDGFFEERWAASQIEYFDVTYTAGRRKKTEDGFKAKRAREVLLFTSAQCGNDE